MWLIAFEINDLTTTWTTWGLVVVALLSLDQPGRRRRHRAWLALGLVVAQGRGRRGMTGALAFASTVVASGLFRALWETTS